MNLARLHIDILQALARYRFLTCRQLHLLGVGSLSAIRRNIRLLSSLSRPARVMDVLRFPPSARFGKMEFVYTLTPHGLIFLNENVPDFQSSQMLAPVWNLFREDYHHRIATVTFRIRLEQLLPKYFAVVSYANYFEKVVSDPFTKPEQATKVMFSNGKVFYPDSIFALRHRSKVGLFAVEIVMGRDQKPILRQIHNHCRALAEGILSQQYGVDKQDYLALFVFQNVKTMHSTMTRLAKKSSFTPFRDHVMLTTIADTERDVTGRWRKVGEDHFLFHFLTGKKSYRLPSFS